MKQTIRTAAAAYDNVLRTIIGKTMFARLYHFLTTTFAHLTTRIASRLSIEESVFLPLSKQIAGTFVIVIALSIAGAITTPLHYVLEFVLFLLVVVLLVSRAQVLSHLSREKENVARANASSESAMRAQMEQKETKDNDKELLSAMQEFCRSLEHDVAIIISNMEGALTGERAELPEQDVLTDQIQAVSDAFARIMHKMDVFVQSILDSGGSTLRSAISLARRTEELSDEMLQNTTEQTKSITLAIRQMESVMETSSEHVAVAVREAANARGEATESGVSIHEMMSGTQSITAAVARVSDAITALKGSSATIGEMAIVITEVADRTNLLALNAAIEAARAGAHGRGFAVVADEVRQLAERTQRASKEITKTIKKIQHEIAEATEETTNVQIEMTDRQNDAYRSEKSLLSIIDRINDMADAIGRISLNNQEQTRVMATMNESVNTIISITEYTSITMGETAWGIQGIESMIKNIVKMTAEQFKSRTKHQQATTPKPLRQQDMMMQTASWN